MNRKEAIKEFKARKVPRGIYAVRCNATGRVWVTSSPNLSAAKNSLWFTLKNRSGMNRDLQAEWNTHGAEAFEYQVLEQLDDDVAPLALGDLLKERKLHWIAELSAQAL